MPSTTSHEEPELPDQPTPKRRPQRRKAKPTCESCYFGRRMLCALELGGPCSTFRPDSPLGLTPPSQPMLLVGEAEAGIAEAERPEPVPA